MYRPEKLEVMNQKTVAYALGVSRHTVARLEKTDADFPRFWELTPGYKVIDRSSFERWLARKRLAAATTT